MEDLKKLTEDIWDELEGAKHYAMKAMHYRGMNDVSTANTYAAMARQELEHMDNLHKMADRLVMNHKAEHPERGKIMEMVWDWEKDKMQGKAAKIRTMIELGK